MSAAESPIENNEPFKANTPALGEPGYLPSNASEPSGASASIGRWLGQAQSELKSRVSVAYRRSSRAIASALQRLRRQGQRIREERPLPALAVISGSAFALGVTLALLRSRRT